MAVSSKSKIRNYLVFVFSEVFVSVVFVSVVAGAASAGFAGAAVIVSAGAAGAGAGVSVVVVVVVLVAAESVVAAAPPPLPHDATKRPIDRASTLNFTNFIISFFRLLCRFIPLSEKGNPPVNKLFSNNLQKPECQIIF